VIVLGSPAGEHTELLLLFRRQLPERVRDLFQRLYRQVGITFGVIARLEEDGGPQHGFHQALIQAATLAVAQHPHPREGVE
jgi:hypothetical protein